MTLKTSSARRGRALRALLASLAARGVLGGCAPLLVGGAVVGGTMVATDRRTTGTQVDDQTIEVQVPQRRQRDASATAAMSTSPATTAWCC